MSFPELRKDVDGTDGAKKRRLNSSTTLKEKVSGERTNERSAATFSFFVSIASSSRHDSLYALTIYLRRLSFSSLLACPIPPAAALHSLTISPVRCGRIPPLWGLRTEQETAGENFLQQEVKSIAAHTLNSTQRAERTNLRWIDESMVILF